MEKVGSARRLVAAVTQKFLALAAWMDPEVTVILPVTALLGTEAVMRLPLVTESRLLALVLPAKRTVGLVPKREPVKVTRVPGTPARGVTEETTMSGAA